MEVAAERFAERFADAVVAIGADEVCGQGRERAAHFAKPAVVDCLVWVLAQGVVADDVVAAGEDDALDAGEAGCLVDVARSDDVVTEDGFPRGAGAGVGAEVDDGVYAVEGGADGVEVGDVGY